MLYKKIVAGLVRHNVQCTGCTWSRVQIPLKTTTVAVFHFVYFFSKNRLIFEILYRARYLSEFDETSLVGFLATRPSTRY